MSYNYFSPNYFGVDEGIIEETGIEITEEIEVTVEYDEIEILVEVE